MVDFDVYKPVREDAMQQAGVSTPEEFATWFAATISQETGCEITGAYTDGKVHLCTDDANMEAVSDALERRGMTHGFR